MTTISKIEYVNKTLKNCFGGSYLLVAYRVETFTNGIKNIYDVDCKLRGIENAMPYPELEIIGIRALSNNSETLIAQALADELNWQCGASVQTEMPEIK